MSTQVMSESLKRRGGEDQGSPVHIDGIHSGPGHLIVLLILALGIYGVMKLLDPQTLPILHVRVKGEFQHLSTSGLQERASEAVRGGFFNVNVETIKKVLLEEPWIRDVSVQRVWPDSITVSIREQAAVARWNDTGLLNGNAEFFAPERSTYPPGLPRLSGPEETSSQVLDFYNHLRVSVPEQYRIEELRLSDRRAWEIGFEEGPVVYLGRTGIADRTKRFIEYVPASLEEYRGMIHSIDMRYTNGFAVQWKPDNKPDL